MKVCKFCSTRMENSVSHCPSCGSNVFLHLCENCGKTFDSGFCPNCGVKAGAARKVCPECGTAYFTNACPNCGYMPGREPAVQRVEQTVIHKHVYEEPVRTSPTPAQARRMRKNGKGCGCGTFLLILLVIGLLAGAFSGNKKKSTSSDRTSTSSSSARTVTVTKDPKATEAPTATPEPAIASAQAVVDSYFAKASAEEIAAVREADSVLYKYSAKKNGKVIEVRRSWESDRGAVGKSKYEPEYIATLGYAAVYTEEDLEKNSAFSTTPWKIPVYRKDRQFWEQDGTIDHKTEVVVIGQELELPKRAYSSSSRCTGYLHVIRMDTGEGCWLNVDNFVVKPYWENSLADAQERGYCIAAFKQVSDYYPVTKGNTKAELEDGTMVLLPVKVMVSGTSPDKVNNPVGGIVFKEWKYGFGGVTVWFNEKDLELTY
ncbi:MAG: hypothetical protein IKO25_08460 [Clostridia bacterium]|nr:hypothetical protein [Clostridia bacterium]